MRIAWDKIGDGEVIEEEVLNGIFEVPYPYVKAEEVAARPQLRKETLEATDVRGLVMRAMDEKVREGRGRCAERGRRDGTSFENSRGCGERRFGRL